MPIEGLTARYRELGRLKFGEDLGDRPTQLDTWRITSPDPQLIQAAAARYGGTPTDTWSEVITQTDSLEVLLPPQDVAAGQWYEAWGSGGLIRRCNGHVTVEVAGDGASWTETGPCVCDPDRRECRLRTVLRVILPDLPDVGIWRLSTGSIYAATELPAAAEVIQRASPDFLAPAVLALEHRETKRRGEAQHQYVVPVLRTTSTLRELLEASAGPRGQLETGGPTGDTPELGSSGPSPAPPAEPLPTQRPQPTHDIAAPTRDQPLAALEHYLEDTDGTFAGQSSSAILASLEILEGLMIEARLWKPDALDAAAARTEGLDPTRWRESDAMTPTLKTFAQRAVLAAVRDVSKRSPTP